ncbi:MAG: VWA domain-containing protein [Planctomycetota bacterium]
MIAAPLPQSGEIAGWFTVGEWSLLDPWFLVALPVFVLVTVLRWLWPRAALPAAQTGLFEGLPRTLRARCVRLPLLLLCLSACVLAVALARPVRRELVPQREEGVDIVLVLDTSSSMKLRDMDDDGRLRRVDAARERAIEFAKARTRDRVAFVAFAHYAELRCPPTLDEDALVAFLSSTDIVPEGTELDGTAIGTAAAKAAQVLQTSDARSKVVVFLSDGEDMGYEDAISVGDAAKLAADSGVRIHTIGLGRGQQVQVGRSFGQSSIQLLPLTFDALKLLSEKTGGRFFEARSDEDLAAVYAAIDQLEKTELEDPRYRIVDGFEWPLGIGLLTLLLALLLDALWIRGVP